MSREQNRRGFVVVFEGDASVEQVEDLLDTILGHPAIRLIEPIRVDRAGAKVMSVELAGDACERIRKTVPDF